MIFSKFAARFLIAVVIAFFCAGLVQMFGLSSPAPFAIALVLAAGAAVVRRELTRSARLAAARPAETERGVSLEALLKIFALIAVGYVGTGVAERISPEAVFAFMGTAVAGGLIFLVLIRESAHVEANERRSLNTA